MITEEFLQFIWKFKLYDKTQFATSKGEAIEVVNAGQWNRNAGPDFLNAQIKIDGTLWGGNVEVHLKASDWHKHQHHTNKAYDNVVLQVVAQNDATTHRSNNTEIPTAQLKFDQRLIENYAQLKHDSRHIPCRDKLPEISSFIIDMWLNTLLIERLEQKATYINKNLQTNNNSWEETFYQQLARNFGFKLNAQPFEMLAKTLPVVVLAKHKNHLNQIEAMLFGQAGMLEKELPDDAYFNHLKQEYRFLQKKFSLVPLEEHLWKFLRLRPSNFPTLRIAQFAQLIHSSSALFSKMIETNDLTQLQQLFDVQASEYWKTHYTFGKKSKQRKKSLGKTAFQNIVINTIVPFLFVYGQNTNKEELKDRAIRFLEQTTAENNRIIRQWHDLQMDIPNAFYSQAFIQLTTNYCNKKECINCQIGNKVILL